MKSGDEYRSSPFEHYPRIKISKGPILNVIAFNCIFTYEKSFEKDLE